MDLIAVVRATGTGKSAFALEIAEHFAACGRECEVVNADAMQLYRGMDIGTAKLAISEQRGIPHRLLDVLDVTDEASVAGYQRQARAAVTAILERGAVALLVGGSGLYVSSVLFDFAFPGTDPTLRARLEAEHRAVGTDALFRRLVAIDAATAATIDRRNPRRIVRALEVIELTGEPKAARLPDEQASWRAHRVVHLTMQREALVARLDARVQDMWRAGLPDEVRGLIPRGIERGVTARRAIGYEQALAEIRGEIARDEAIAATQQATRGYARRQVSWFKRYRDQLVIDGADAEARAAAIRALRREA